MVFRTDRVRLSSRFRRSLRGSRWQVRADTAFEKVIAACADAPRAGQRGTWITSAMRDAYVALHRLGHAHSVEAYDDGRLVGGIYGVAIGRMFFGESMFSAASGGSKVALAALAHRLRQWDWPLIDAQVENGHLLRLGAVVPDLLVDHRLEARAIGSGLRAEDAAAGATLSRLFGNALRDQRGGFSAMAGCGGVVLFRLVQRHDGAGGAVDQVDLFREGVPEERSEEQTSELPSLMRN